MSIRWKDIEGFEGHYQISDRGEVKSIPRYVPTKKGGLFYVKGCILKPKIDKDGYHEYSLRKDWTNTYKRAHRLVAEAFVDGYEDGLVVDHIDNTKDNNHYANLQWVTNCENTIKYYSEDYSEGRTLSSLTRYEWSYARWLFESGISYEGIIYNLGLEVKKPESMWDVFSGRRLATVSGFSRGEIKKRNHPVQKLRDEQVLEILHKRINGKVALRVLSEEYDIAESMVSRFCKGTRRPEMLEKFKESESCNE